MTGYAPLALPPQPAPVPDASPDPSDRFGRTLGYIRPGFVINTLSALLGLAVVALAPLAGVGVGLRVAAALLALVGLVTPTAVQVLGLRLVGGRTVRTGWLRNPAQVGATGEVHLVGAWLMPWAVQTLGGEVARARRARAALLLVPLAMVGGYVYGVSFVPVPLDPPGTLPGSRWWVPAVISVVLGWLLVLPATTGALRGLVAPRRVLAAVPLTPAELVRVLDEQVTTRRPLRLPEVDAIDRWGRRLPDAFSRHVVDHRLFTATRTQRSRLVQDGAVALLGVAPEMLRGDVLPSGTPLGLLGRSLLCLVDGDSAGALAVLDGSHEPDAHLVRAAAYLALGDLAAARAALGPPPSVTALATDPYLALARGCGVQRQWGDALLASVADGTTTAAEAVQALACLDPDRLPEAVGEDLALVNGAVWAFACAGELERLRSATGWVDRLAEADEPSHRDSAGLARVLLGDADGRSLLAAPRDDLQGACCARLVDGASLPFDPVGYLAYPLDPATRRLLVQAARA